MGWHAIKINQAHYNIKVTVVQSTKEEKNIVYHQILKELFSLV